MTNLPIALPVASFLLATAAFFFYYVTRPVVNYFFRMVFALIGFFNLLFFTGKFTSDFVLLGTAIGFGAFLCIPAQKKFYALWFLTLVLVLANLYFFVVPTP